MGSSNSNIVMRVSGKGGLASGADDRDSLTQTENPPPGNEQWDFEVLANLARQLDDVSRQHTGGRVVGA